MEKVVFTNGCFDIIHPGHVDLLNRAKALGSKLIVGINSDRSVTAIKGRARPFVKQQDRKAILEGLNAVDEVKVFDELTPEKLIRELKPNVLVKGGDWSEDEIVGAAFVKEYGGEVFSLELVDGYSSSSIVERIQKRNDKDDSPEVSEMSENSLVGKSLKSHVDLVQKIIGEDNGNIEKCANLIFETVKSGNKILICGNGGSASDAQHIATEFVGRFETERTALPAIALNTDTSALTAISNDYGFERVFARQVEALGNEGDLLIGISTSGTSPNVIAAVMTARSKGCKILGMTGAKGKKLASLSDECLMVPDERTCRIQEVHILIAHIWCEFVDRMVEEHNL